MRGQPGRAVPLTSGRASLNATMPQRRSVSRCAIVSILRSAFEAIRDRMS
jgi:hypothetical protein